MTDEALLLEKTTHALTGTQDFQQLAEKSVRLIVKELENEGLVSAAIYRVRPEQKTLYAYAYAARNQKTIDKLLEQDFFDLTTPISNTGNLTVKTVLTNKIQQSPDLNDFTKGVLSNTVTSAIQKIVGMKLNMCFPIVLKSGKVGGAILYMLKDKSASPQHIELFQTYAGQLGLAFSNVLAFEKLTETYRRDIEKFGAGSSQKENTPSIKFTLRITPQENRHLSEIAQKSNKTKAEIIRDLIDNAE